MATISESLFPWIDEDDLPPQQLAKPVDDTPLIELSLGEPARKPVSLWTTLASRWQRAGAPMVARGAVPDEAGRCPCRP